MSTARWADRRRFVIDASRIAWLGAVVAIVVALAAAWFWAPGSAAPVSAEAAVAAGVAPSVPETVGDAGITVHVSGAVFGPGLVELLPGARVADAVAAAGGTLRTADLAALNLAAPVRDGEQIRVPELAIASNGGVAIVDDGLVRINDADATGLEALPGVGPVLAGRIVAVREESGPFATVEDLLDVPGIGEATLAGLRDVVAVP